MSHIPLRHDILYQYKTPHARTYQDIGEYLGWEKNNHVFKRGQSTVLLGDGALANVRPKPKHKGGNTTRRRVRRSFRKKPF